MENAKKATTEAGAACKEDISKMKSLEHLRAVIVTLVSNAKCEESDPSMSMKCYAMMSALEEFDWGQLSTGTNTVRGIYYHYFTQFAFTFTLFS